MKQLISWTFRPELQINKNLSTLILFFRLFLGLIMLPYGLGKIENFDTYTVEFFNDPIGIGMVPSLILTIFAQVICSVLIILGLQTRFASIVLAFNMLIAVKFHFYDPFFDKALPLIFGALYLMLIVMGSGKYSVDYYLFNSLQPSSKPAIAKREIMIITSMVLAFVFFWLIFVEDFMIHTPFIIPLLLFAALLVFLLFIFSAKGTETKE